MFLFPLYGHKKEDEAKVNDAGKSESGKAEDEVGILIYKWLISEYSGNTFSQPRPFTETQMDWRPSHSFTIN